MFHMSFLKSLIKIRGKVKTFSRISLVSVNFSDFAIFRHWRKLKLDWGVKFFNTNLCGKFQLISYNRSIASYNNLMFFLIFCSLQSEVLKFDNPKSNQFYVLQIQKFRHRTNILLRFVISLIKNTLILL